MNIVITMAGLGSRFRKEGYREPKYMLRAKGHTLFYWSLISLRSFHHPDANYTFVVRKEDDASTFIASECRQLGIACFHVVQLDHLTDGQASTVLAARPAWQPLEPLLIYNIDTHVHPAALSGIPEGVDGWIPCFSAPGEQWSFVKLDGCGFATAVSEKSRISDHATIGLYWFASATLYEEAYEAYYVRGSREEKGERYVAPLYNQLLQDGRKVVITTIPSELVQILGTPEELEAFRHSHYTLQWNTGAAEDRHS